MPRKRKNADSEVSSTRPNNRSTSSVIAAGGGTANDIKKLSHTLGLPTDAVTAIMNCQGQGVRSSRRGGVGDDGAAAAAAMDPSMMNVWGDFMNEEMETAPAAPAAAASKEASSSKPASTSSSNNGPRSYILPIQPHATTPGLLAQTGTLDSSVPGRSSISKTPAKHELECPTLLFPTSVFGKDVKIAHIATSPTACHSVAITTTGKAYGWGRNETGQLGLGYTSACVPLPTELTIPGEENEVTFVAAGVGKYHTILLGSNGLAYASGGNVCGQLGINNMGVKQIEKFRKCSVMGQLVDDDDEVNVKIVQVSCVWVCVVAFCCVVFFSSLSGVPKHFFYFFLFLEYSRSPAVKKFLLSYAPRDICIPPVPLNLDYSVMAKQANTSLQLVDWDMLIVPNSCVVMSLSKAKPMPLLQLVAQ